MISLDIWGQKPTHLFLDRKAEKSQNAEYFLFTVEILQDLILALQLIFYLVVSYLYPERPIKLFSLYYQPANEFVRSHNSRVDKFVFSFYYVYLFNVVLFILLLEVSYQKIYCQGAFFLFSSRSFMVSVLTFKSLVHLELIFVRGVG